MRHLERIQSTIGLKTLAPATNGRYIPYNSHSPYTETGVYLSPILQMIFLLKDMHEGGGRGRVRRGGGAGGSRVGEGASGEGWDSTKYLEV